MQGDELLSRIGLFVLVSLAVGALFTIPAMSGQPVSDEAELDISSHNSANILAETPAETGSVSVEAAAEPKHVVIDAAHSNGIDRASLDPIVSALTEAGHDVSFYRGSAMDSINTTLRQADAFVVISPGTAYSAEDKAGLEAFVDAGGRVLFAGEPTTQTGGTLTSLVLGSTQVTSSTPLTGLAASFGVAYGDGYVYDLERYDLNYRNVYATPSGSEFPSEANVTVHEAVPVRGGTPVLETVDTAKVSSDREAATYPVATRNGDVLAVGDASLFDTEWAQRNDNEEFVGAAIEFLVNGEKTPGAPTQPQSSQGPGTPTAMP
ncbi:MAG: DUF4350 domain-containing protein [Halobacteriota archaeon]